MEIFKVIFDFLKDHYPALLFVLAAIIGTAVIMKWLNSWRNRVTHVERECTKIDREVIPKLDSLTRSTTSISTSVKGLIVYLKSKDTTMETSLFVVQSPMQMTDLGEKILTEIGGREFVDKQYNRLVPELKNKNIKSALDVQNLAPNIIENHVDDDSFTLIKNYLYNHPKFEVKLSEGKTASVNLDLTLAFTLMGIYFRNKYLADNPNLQYPPEEQKI